MFVSWSGHYDDGWSHAIFHNRFAIILEEDLRKHVAYCPLSVWWLRIASTLVLSTRVTPVSIKAGNEA